MRNKIIKILGGFTEDTLREASTEMLLEALKSQTDETSKRKILAEAVKHLWSSVTADDILRNDGKGWTFEGLPITNSEFASVREEAQRFLSMRLWKVLQKDIRYQVGKKMFEQARHPDDVLWGQLITFLNDVIETRLRSLAVLERGKHL